MSLETDFKNRGMFFLTSTFGDMMIETPNCSTLPPEGFKVQNSLVKTTLYGLGLVEGAKYKMKGTKKVIEEKGASSGNPPLQMGGSKTGFAYQTMLVGVHKMGAKKKKKNCLTEFGK